MRRKILGLVFIGIIFLMAAGIPSWAAKSTDTARPILILIVDKLDNSDLFQSKLPGIMRLLTEGSCGLLNVRSGNGYSSNGGYLSIGTGNRATVPEKPMEWINVLKWFQANPEYAQSLDDLGWGWIGKPGRDLNISNGRDLSGTPVVPEIGLLKNEFENVNRGVTPGLLGTVMRQNGWRTCLIGDRGNKSKIATPGSFLIMDGQGIIDEIIAGKDINEEKPYFPYHSYFNNEKAFQSIQNNLGPRRIIVVDFPDFARLDDYRSDMMPERFALLKKISLRHLDQLIQSITNQWTNKDMNFVLLSPSISQEGVMKKNLLAPIVIRSDKYTEGLMVSGTTKWPGLVANIDILPTVLHMAGLKVPQGLPGRLIKTGKKSDYLQSIGKFAQAANQSTVGYRPLIDWYLGLISIGWIGFMFLYGFKQKKISDGILTFVGLAPFILLVLPLFPTGLWNVGGFTVMTILLTLPFLMIQDVRVRFLVLSALFWLVLVGDQITGWYLGRFSALGYGSTGGARYYGMGNEYMGIFLALSIFMADWFYRLSKWKWPVILILGVTVFVLGWPQFGINFGGTLAALFGFGFYLCILFKIRLKSSKFWVTLTAVGLVVLAVGWWDSTRNPEVQTHLGRFFKNVFQKQWLQVFQVIGRKMAMNLKLIASSPWTRILILSLLTGLFCKIIYKMKIIAAKDTRAWFGVLASAFGALIFNDSGVIAMATCLAYAWTVFLGYWLHEERTVEKQSQPVNSI